MKPTAQPPAPPLPLVRHHREGGDERPRLLDLFCCEGGAAMGYHRAGFDVIGIDIERQRRYPFPVVQGDALVMGPVLLRSGRFAAVHASPPCQTHSITKHTHSAAHPDHLEDTRTMLLASGLPFVIENVEGAPMPGSLTLCGSEFGLQATDVDGQVVTLRRHRQFESNIALWGAGGCSCVYDRHLKRIAGVYGAGNGDKLKARHLRKGGYTPIKSVAENLLGIDWMTQHGLQQSIPPAYTQFIGEQLLAHIAAERAA